MYYLHLVQMFGMLFITDTTRLWDCGHRLWAGGSAAFRNSGSQSRASSGVCPPMRYGNEFKHFIQDQKDISRGLKNGEDLILYFKTCFFFCLCRYHVPVLTWMDDSITMDQTYDETFILLLTYTECISLTLQKYLKLLVYIQ